MKKKDASKVVVVGGAGFIGSHIVDAFVRLGYETHVIDNLSGGKKEHVNRNAALHVMDICDYDAIAPIVKGAKYVFHLAALPRVQYSIEHPRETHDVNVTGTMNVLLASKEGEVKRVVYSASSSAYGDQEILPLAESLPAHPLSPYGLHKYIGELYARMFNDVYGLEAVSLRYFNVYGPRQDPEGAYALVIGKFLKQRAEGKTLTITGDGEQTRDFTHVNDVVKANLLAAQSPNVGKGEVINIGSGSMCSIKELASMLGGEIEHIAPRLEPKHTLADISRARTLLGWEPEITLEDGIKDLLKIEGIQT